MKSKIFTTAYKIFGERRDTYILRISVKN